MSLDGTKEITEIFEGKVFSFPKSISLIENFIDMSTKADKNAIILDFFSGSATTAHAVMQLNAEDGGYRKFIMVQVPEYTYDAKTEEYTDENGEKKKKYVMDETIGYPVVVKDSTARKAGYYTIPQIGEERIRRAGKKIKEETGADIDYGFRVFKVDSSNMEDVYYKASEYNQEQMELFANNIKEDRTPEDLLFQVMLDLGVLLSSKIEETEIAGKKVFNVAEGFLLACFDENVTEETVKAVAEKKPYYAVFRDSSMANDSVATNFDQIFETISPETVRKVL
jgi:adenine-specific DNA-methyltransferase